MTTTTQQSGVSESPSGSTTPSDRPSDITPLDVAKKALELAEANPDFVYVSPVQTAGINEDCFYFWKGRPSCLFGQALAALGFGPDDVAEFAGINVVLERLFPDPAVKSDADRFAKYGGLDIAQSYQDEGEPWGKAAEPIRTWIKAHS